MHGTSIQYRCTIRHHHLCCKVLDFRRQTPISLPISPTLIREDPHFQDAYPNEAITKEDLFYYIYGILHSPDYRERYADNLAKELPRIPRVQHARDFWHFSKAGRELGHLHLNYESVEKYPLTLDTRGRALNTFNAADYRVEKMKFAKKKDPETGKSINDRSTVIYNTRITLKNIPAEAWEYVVNGKAALDWVMERQSVKTDKDSGIVNDANDWAIETMDNPAYSLELFQRVVTVSIETMKIGVFADQCG